MRPCSAAACDVYSYGLVLCEMLTDRVPFEGMHEFTIMNRVGVHGERPELGDRPTAAAAAAGWTAGHDRPTAAAAAAGWTGWMDPEVEPSRTSGEVPGSRESRPAELHRTECTGSGIPALFEGWIACRGGTPAAAPPPPQPPPPPPRG